MARLRDGEREHKTRRVQAALDRHPLGIRESEIAGELGWNRRTLNAYLRALEERGLAYKEGWEWYADDWSAL